MNQMEKRKISSSWCRQGTIKASRVWRPTIGDAKICQLQIGQVSVKGIRRRITIGNDLFWSRLPSVMNDNEDKIIKSDKPREVGKSINIEDKLT